jgi:hypothetical protein
MHLGGTVDSMLRSMPESELQGWAKYARVYGFPQRRIELMLAQLANLIARTMGGVKDSKVTDFMLKEPEDEEMPANVTRLETVRAAFGFNPRKKK